MKLKISKPQMLEAIKVGRTIATDLAGAAGVGMLVHGLAMIYEPLAWLVGGLGLIAAAVLLQKPAKAP